MATVGIDLGTTNTVAALDGEVLELADAGKRRAILPSVVAFPPSGTTLVGSAAKRRRAIDPRNTIFSAKRIIGRGWLAQETRAFRERYPFELVKAPGETPAFRTRAGVKTPIDVAAQVLGAVAAHLPAGARAVVTVPSGFQVSARQATADAARAAGLARAEILDEPMATAWAYFAGGRTGGARYLAVFDLGGGTFDLAVVDCARQPFQLVAHGGDLYLGGDDVDLALAQWAAEETLRQHRWDMRTDAEVFDRLVAECEAAKIRLSQGERTRIELQQVDPLAPVSGVGIAVDRAMLARLTTDLVRRTFAVCDEVLARAGLKTKEIGAILLAGGSSQLPHVRAGIDAYFGKAPRCDYDPMEVVSIGASLSARP